MGHSEGICHVYVHDDANYDKAKRIVVDAKTDYPSACNAVETILLHSNLVKSGVAKQLIAALVESGVKVNGGPVAAKEFNLKAAKSFREEYGDLEVTIEIVSSVEQAIEHINSNSSSHTVTRIF
jgi:delta-1-pyrroline-5-carboxylate synthetase